MSDANPIVNTLKAKALLLIQREREIFSLRLEQERIRAWLQAFRRLSARARPESGRAMYAEWTAAMIEERHFQTAAAFRYEVSTGQLLLVHGQSHARLPEGLCLDEAARRALRDRREGMFVRTDDPDAAALARCLEMQCLVWFAFAVDPDHQMLLVAGVAAGIGGAQGAVCEEDHVYFAMVGEHLAALMRNYALITQLASATQNLQELFDHMKQAIVAFDASGSICGASSRQAKVLFERDDLEGLAVRDLLYPAAPPYDIDATSFSEWVDLALHVSPGEWPSCERHAPREVVIPQGDGRTVLLELEFRPLVRDGRITHVILSAYDVTVARQLEEAVHTHEAEHTRQVAAMRRLIAGGPQVFIDFIDSARTRIRRCEAILGECTNGLPTDAIDELFRQAHTIRSEARAFDLVELESAAKSIEETLDELRNEAHRATRVDDDRSVATLGTQLRQVAEAVERGCDALVAASSAGVAIFDRVTASRAALRELTEYAHRETGPLKHLVARLTAVPFGMTTVGSVDSVSAWAEAEGIDVAVVVAGRELMVQEELAQVLPGVLSHLVRNSIAHGIEPSEERVAAGKPARGTIRVTAEPTPRGPRVTVEDDGRGLDVARILGGADGVAASRDPANLVFEPGFSTRGTVDAMAGYGVGLDAVRRELARVGYDVELTFAPRQWTRFMIVPRTDSSY